MRGWKVAYDPDDGILEVGPTRGTPRRVRVSGIGHAPGSDFRYLLYELADDEQDELSEKAAKALIEYLDKHHGSSWDLTWARILNPSWPNMSEQEKHRLMRREGFEGTHALP